MRGWVYENGEFVHIFLIENSWEEWQNKYIKPVENLPEYIIQKLKESRHVSVEFHCDVETAKNILKTVIAQLIDLCPFANLNYTYKYGNLVFYPTVEFK